MQTRVTRAHWSDREKAINSGFCKYALKDVYLWNDLIAQSLDANAFENRADKE
ncbi:hypothetical protein [Sphingobacterium lactis]|uniref:hypothetical protein n=1 Tax=Sphingobacterium lactis TaxID=797291 RepID=UPI003DA60240